MSFLKCGTFYNSCGYFAKQKLLITLKRIPFALRRCGFAHPQIEESKSFKNSCAPLFSSTSVIML